MNDQFDLKAGDQQSLQTMFISNTFSPQKSFVGGKFNKEHETILLTNLSKEQIQKCDDLIKKLVDLQNQRPLDLDNEEMIKIEIFKKFEKSSEHKFNNLTISDICEKENTVQQQHAILKQSVFSNLLSDKSKFEIKLYHDSLAYSIDDPAINENIQEFEAS